MHGERKMFKVLNATTPNGDNLDMTTLSPDDSANKLFDHPSIISQTRKEPLFDIHYALQILIGKFLIEVPFVLKPTGQAETKAAFASANESNVVKFIPSEVTEIKHSGSSRDIKDHFAEPDESDKLFVGSPDYTFVPLVPVYEKPPEDGNSYRWPELGTFGSNQKLIWHPDEKEEKEQKEKEAKEVKKQKKKEAKEDKVKAKKEKKSNKKEKGDNKETEPLLSKDADEPSVSRVVVQEREFKSLEPSGDGNFVETETRFIETRTVKVVEHHGDSPSQITETVTVIEGHGQDAPITTTYETTRNELVRTERTPESQETEIIIQKEALPEVEIRIEDVDNDKNDVDIRVEDIVQKLEDTAQKVEHILERSEEVTENGEVHIADDVEQNKGIKKPLPQSNGEIGGTKEVEETS
uniref:Titin n=1 Tax=Bursaphelenchus xylophilus TaxID=6326 RepID=A0A1I7SM88_BURXY